MVARMTLEDAIRLYERREHTHPRELQALAGKAPIDLLNLSGIGFTAAHLLSGHLIDLGIWPEAHRIPATPYQHNLQQRAVARRAVQTRRREVDGTLSERGVFGARVSHAEKQESLVAAGIEAVRRERERYDTPAFRAKRHALYLQLMAEFEPDRFAAHREDA